MGASGLQSLFLSRKSPTYPQIGFDWPITPSIDFSYFHGELFSGVRDSRSGSGGVKGPQKIWVDRYIVAHRLQWQPIPALTLAFNESVVYGGKPVETMYLLPFILFFSAEHFLGDADNVQIQLDASWRPIPAAELYLAWFIDDWGILDSFNSEFNQNHFGWLGGLAWSGLLREDDRLKLEGSWTDARIYRHAYDITFYENRGYPLGHWTGAHAQSLELRYAVPLGSFWLQAEAMHARRGALTRQMLEEQYDGQVVFDRFGGGSEALTRAAVQLYRQVAGKLWLEAGVSVIQWENTGFSPASPGVDSMDINKVSLNLGFYYNFSLPGYSITNLLER